MESLDLDQGLDLGCDLFCFEVIFPPCSRVVPIVRIDLIVSIDLEDQRLVHVSVFGYVFFGCFVKTLVDGFVFFRLELVEDKLVLSDTGKGLELAYGHSMAAEKKLQISVPGGAEADIVFADSVVVAVKTLAKVEVPPHVGVIKENVLDQVADEIAGPVEGGIVLMVVDIFFLFDIQLLQMSPPY
jgi:hypothetical protein